VCPVQLPGRENRLMVPPFTRLMPLVQELGQSLLPYMDLPFAFFGHSMGALIAFELARKLRRRRASGPGQLFVSACRAPQIPDPAQPLHELPESRFIEEFCRRYDSIPPAVLQNGELLQLFLPAIKADMSLIETYVYEFEEPLECPISAFGGLEDREASSAELTAWREQTTSIFDLRMLEGDHFFLKSQREIILEAISGDLLAHSESLSETDF
jgi:medium-chain acyl-[acyl-carrier-protein] hydrolase